jgi:hypothetical protein
METLENNSGDKLKNMGKSEDRRKSKRVALFDDFHVLDAETGELLGYIRDVSSRGCMVTGTLALVVERRYKLAVVFPEPIVGEKVLKLEATCRWHTYNAKRGFHEAGFQFGELAILESHLLQQIQTEYEFSVTEGGV